jgi:hypothetical protein
VISGLARTALQLLAPQPFVTLLRLTWVWLRWPDSEGVRE